MGYDCTLHVVDPLRIKEDFCRRVLEGDPAPGLSKENWATLSSMLEDRTDAVEAARTLALGALAFAAAELPYHYERGFCLSLWQDHMEEERLQATVPQMHQGTTADLDELFAPLIDRRSDLGGRFPVELGSNYSTGIYIPRANVTAVLKWARGKVRAYRKPEQRLFRGLLLVLEEAERRGLAYWEGSEVPGVELRTILPPEQQRPSWLEAHTPPRIKYLECRGEFPGAGAGHGPVVAFADGVGFPQRCQCGFCDLSSWPPRWQFIDEYPLAIDRSREGRWVTAAMISPRPYDYHVRVGDLDVTRHEVPVNLGNIEPRKNGIMWASFVGRYLFAATNSEKGSIEHLIRDVMGGYWSITEEGRTCFVMPDGERLLPPLKPAVPLREEGAVLRPVVELPEPRTERAGHAIVHLRDGTDVLLWDGRGYELRDSGLVPTFELAPSVRASFVAGGVSSAFYYVGASEPDAAGKVWQVLWHVNRGETPVRCAEQLFNLMQISEGPARAVLVKLGDNKRGEVGAVYFPDHGPSGSLIYLGSDLFPDEDPQEISSLHWSDPAGRLIAATPRRLWAVPVDRVLSLARVDARTGRKL